MASYAQELQALKTDLQRSLARLELDSSSFSPSSTSRQHVSTSFIQQSAANAVESAETVRNVRNSVRNRPSSRWSRRRLVRELAAASERRRELETQLQQEIISDRPLQTNEQSGRSGEWRAAIAELQQQRAEIQRQMEEEVAVNTEQEVTRERVTVVGDNESVSETQYSIGGVVTLEPLRSLQRNSFSVRPAIVPRVDAFPRYRNSPDALNDVFTLQVKFAETMLKLEKSVQIRDQLLHHRTDTHHRGNRTRRRSRQRRESLDSGINSDTSVMYRRTRSGDSFSSSAYSFSSLDTTPRRGENIRVRYPNFQVSRATTAETLAPSSSSVTHVAAGGTSNVETQSEVTEHLQEESHSTPTTDSSGNTCTTGSDQKSNASSKQVRFGDDAYSTPILARKFNFDNPSMDEDDEEKTEDEQSLLSFLGGSSVTSAELNDASFVRAFQRFRRELTAPRNNARLQSPVLSRQLFPASKVEFPSLDSQIEGDVSVSGETDNTTGLDIPDQTQAQDLPSTFPELSGLNLQELQERRRQLCLDIQAASAQLVLNFGAMQSGTTRSQDAQHTKNSLLALRDELNAVDMRISTLQ